VIVTSLDPAGAPTICGHEQAATNRTGGDPVRPHHVAAAVGVPLAVGAVVWIEVVVAAGRDYLADVDYTVTATVPPPEGTPARAVEPFRLWVLGDSTAAGVGAVDAASSLPVLVAERLAAAEARPVEVRGLGVSGARTRDVLEQQIALLPDTGALPAPDAVVIVIGANDVTHVTPPRIFSAQTTAMVTGARSRTGAPVILGGIPRFAGVAALPQPLRGLTDRFAGVMRARQRRAAAREPDVTYVDIAALASPRFIGRPDAMSRDAFHPSEVGYGFWADALAPAVIAARAHAASRPDVRRQPPRPG
jgi:lysophospholipase L1-like esterase